MKTLLDSLPNPNASNAPAKRPNELSAPAAPISSTTKTTKQQDKERFFNLRNLIIQSFETFDVYGKQAEAIDTLTNVFFDVLDGIENVDITAAFKAYAKIGKSFPKPADILELAKEARDGREAKSRLQATSGSKNGLTSFSGKRYHEMTDAMKSDLRDHLGQFIEKEREREIHYWTAFKYLPLSVAESWFPGWKSPPKSVVVSRIPEDDGIEL